MIHAQGFNLEFWAKVVNTTVYIKNQCLMKALDSKNLQEALVVNNTWSLVPLPKGRKPIFCIWVFKVKHGVDGEVEHYKAKLVARGFTQTFGVNLQQNFYTCYKVCINLLYPCTNSHWKHGNSSNGCQNHIFQWWLGRGDLPLEGKGQNATIAFTTTCN